MAGKHLVAVIGGACAGSEMVDHLVRSGCEVVVFEQNELPYGKIEDGLPRWHEKLQARERKAIDRRLGQPGVHFIPKCRLGMDVLLKELVETWGLSLVILANGAWRDRQLKVEGVELVQDDSLVYQNPFVYWFNHFPEANYTGKTFQISGGAIVIGGGLASIDMVKICQFETLRRALAERGHEADVVKMEHHGVHKVCQFFDLDYDALEIEPAKLFYRKRVRDMPLVPLPADVSVERLAKAEQIREKLVNNGRKKYGYEVYPLHVPKRVEVVEGRVGAVEFERTRYENGKLKYTGEFVKHATSLVISSIGSIPEPLPGIPMNGELYETQDPISGRLLSMAGVFCVGNVITGRGNIKDSYENARRLAKVFESGFTGSEVDYEKIFKTQRDMAAEHFPKILAHLKTIDKPDDRQRRKIVERIKAMQRQRQYEGDFAKWRDRILRARSPGSG